MAITRYTSQQGEVTVLKKVGIGCGAIIGLFLILGIISAALSGGESPTQASQPTTVAAQEPTAPESEKEKEQAPASTTEPTNTPEPEPTSTPEPKEQGTRENPYPKDAEVLVDNIRWKIIRAEIADELPQLFDQTLKPRGKFVVVSVEVENQGDEPETLTELDLYDSKGRKFAPISELVEVEPEQIFFETANPGLPLQYTTVFDVPQDAEGFTVTVSNLKLFGAKLAHVSIQ